ncbi:T-cell surface glycoprotein CD8 alpha chain [Rhea pennata]|uniref:T-cell surface glycoprotein CD8 alpha chain n=1 Tax=Rhea pennata TaxID=8795 RepID=UPI002E25A131
MGSSPLLLFLLSLDLCCSRIQGQTNRMTAKFRDSKITHPQLRQRLELECLFSIRDSGVSWIRQDKDGTLHFIVFISSLSQTTFQRNERTSARFEARKGSTSSQLVVKSFSQQDQGNYFCLINSNQMLYFSTGQPAFLPVTTTAAPTTESSTAATATCPKHLSSPLSFTPAGRSNKTWLNFSCDIFIWVPLASSCLLLLIALVITIMLCQKARRRRCRCKRPANEKPKGKPIMPNQRM